MLCILEGKALLSNVYKLMSLLLELLILSVFSSPDMELVALPFRERGDCTHEWFRVQNNGVRNKISSQGEFCSTSYYLCPYL